MDGFNRRGTGVPQRPLLAPSAGHCVYRDLGVQGAEGLLPARLYRRPHAVAKRDTLLVFFHGGSFQGGAFNDNDALLAPLASSDPGLVILAPGYTVAERLPFRSAFEDAHAVLQWVRENRSSLAWSGRHLIVAGIEAGANLAAVAALTGHLRGAPRLAGQVLIEPLLAPGLWGADGGLHGGQLQLLPPSLLLASDAATQCDAEVYSAALEVAGVSALVRRLPAVMQGQPATTVITATVAEMASFIRHLRRGQQ